MISENSHNQPAVLNPIFYYACIVCGNNFYSVNKKMNKTPIPNHICKFCNRKCNFVTREHFLSPQWECNPCDTLYMATKYSNILMTMYCFINKKEFKVIVKNNVSEIYCDGDYVTTINEQTNITPKNIKQKLPLYITFS
jgi:hypothetical protein